MPYKIYPQEGKNKKGKQKFVSVNILSFTDPSVWENVCNEIKRQVLEMFEKNNSTNEVLKEK